MTVQQLYGAGGLSVLISANCVCQQDTVSGHGLIYQCSVRLSEYLGGCSFNTNVAVPRHFILLLKYVHK